MEADNRRRKPRHHPDVQKTAKVLWKCVTMMPYSGTLFTSQAPFCPIFIASLVSIEKKDRVIAEEWFTTVGLKGKCRSVSQHEVPNSFICHPALKPAHI